MLLGIAIRTGSPLSLNLAEPVWKQLAGMSLTIADLSEVTSRRERTEKWDSVCPVQSMVGVTCGLVKRHSLP